MKCSVCVSIKHDDAINLVQISFYTPNKLAALRGFPTILYSAKNATFRVIQEPNKFHSNDSKSKWPAVIE